MLRFGTNGIRAKFDELNPKSAVEIAKAFAHFLDGKKVAVAHDHRKTSPCIYSSVLAGVMAAGCDALALGLCSTPAAAAWAERNADGALIITASHNPPEWNAIKAIARGRPISKERGVDVLKYLSKSFVEWDKVGKIKRIEGITEWHIALIKKVIGEQNENKDVRVIGDFGHGVASLYAKFFAEICDFTSLNANIDAFFPSRPSEPREENLCMLKQIIKDGDFDLGLAWDGDGDRLVLVDKEGHFIPGDVVLALCILAMNEEKEVKKVVTTVSTGRVVEDAARMVGAEVHYSKVGSPYLVEKMKETQADIGGEEVGGVIWPRASMEKDALLTAAKLVCLLQEGRFYDYLKQLPKYVIIKDKMPCNEKRWEIIDKLKTMCEEKYGKERVIGIDGVRINFDDGWAIVRASGTEPCIRVFCEAKEENVARDRIEKIKQDVVSLI